MASNVDGKIKLNLGVDVDSNGVVKSVEQLRKSIETESRAALQNTTKYFNNLLQIIESGVDNAQSRALKGFLKYRSAMAKESKDMDSLTSSKHIPIGEQFDSNFGNQTAVKVTEITDAVSDFSISMQQASGFASDLANALGTHLAVSIESTCGYIINAEGVIGRLNDHILGLMGGAENFARITELMQFPDSDKLGDFLGDFGEDIGNDITLVEDEFREITQEVDYADVAFQRTMQNMTASTDKFTQQIHETINTIKMLPAIMQELPSTEEFLQTEFIRQNFILIGKAFDPIARMIKQMEGRGGQASLLIEDKSLQGLEEFQNILNNLNFSALSEVGESIKGILGNINSTNTGSGQFVSQVDDIIAKFQDLEQQAMSARDIISTLQSEGYSKEFIDAGLGEFDTSSVQSMISFISALGSMVEKLKADFAELRNIEQGTAQLDGIGDKLKSASEMSDFVVRVEKMIERINKVQFTMSDSLDKESTAVQVELSKVINDYQAFLDTIKQLQTQGYSDEQIERMLGVQNLQTIVGDAQGYLQSLIAVQGKLDAATDGLRARYLQGVRDFKVTPEDAKGGVQRIVNVEDYKTAVAIEEALNRVNSIESQISAKQEEIAKQEELKNQFTAGTGPYETAEAKIIDFGEDVQVLQKQLSAAKKEYDRLVNPSANKPVRIVDKAEYENSLKILNTMKLLEDAQQRLSALETKRKNALLNDKQTKGSGAYADILKDISATEREIVALKGELDSLGGSFDESGNKAKDNADKMVSAYSVVANAFSKLFPGIGSQIGTVIDSVGKLIENNSDVSASANQMAQQTANAGSQMASSVAQNANLIISIISAIFSLLTSVIKKAVQLGERAIAYFRKGLASIRNVFMQVISSVHQLNSRMNSLVRGSLKKFTSLISKGFHKSHNNNFKKMLSMVLRYGLGIRSTYMLFRKLKQMITEGFPEMAKVSERFNRAISDIKATWGQFKGQVSAAFEPLITYFAPAIVRIIELMNEATLSVTKFFGALAGYKKVLRATKTMADYAASVGNANKQLAGFDELNNLTSSGSGSDDPFASGWEWVDAELPEWWQDLVDMWGAGDFSSLGRAVANKIVEALTSIKWGEIADAGENVARAFSTFLNGLFTDEAGNLDTTMFDTIGRTVSKFVHMVLSVFGTLVSAFDFENFGKAIASGLSSLFDYANNNGTWKHLTFVASKIGKGIVKLVSEVITSDGLLADIGSAFGEFINAIISMFSNIVYNGKWSEIGSSIGECIVALINKIDWTTWGTVIGDGLANIGVMIDNAINTIFSTDYSGAYINWSVVATNVSSAISGIISAISDTINGLNFDDIASAISMFFYNLKVEDIGKSISDFINSLSSDGVVKTVQEALSGFIGRVADESNGTKNTGLFGLLNSMLTNIDFDQLITNVSAMLTELLVQIGANMDKIISTLSSSIDASNLGKAMKDIVSGVLQVLYNVASNEDFEQWLSDLLDAINLPSLIQDFGSVICEYIDLLPMDDIIEAFLELFLTKIAIGEKVFGEIVVAIFTIIGNMFKEHADVLKDDSEQILSAFNDIVKYIIQGLTNGFDNEENRALLWNAIKEFCNAMITLFCDIFGIHSPSTVAEEWGKYIMEGLANGIIAMKDTVVEKMNVIKAWVLDVFAKIRDKSGERITAMKDRIVSIFTALKNALKTPINGIITFINSLLSGVTSGINKVIDSLNGLTISPPQWMVDAASALGISLGDVNFSIPKIPSYTIPALAQGAVLPPNKPFLAQLGDQKNGVNIETPLSTMLEAFNMAFAQNSDNDQMMAMMQQQIQLLTVIANKEFGITNRQIFKSVQTSANEYKNTTGKTAFT